ncbi:MAG: radical SAM protein [Proteobacteria bacterium]|nr:radical SAM protein [Pseudomonadota bacterium]
MEKKFKYIYGPVPSWRVGSSLGIDLLSQEEKICSYDCVYCQLGKTKSLTATRQLYVPEDMIVRELEMLPADITIDYITLSGRGEPTLAINLGDTINTIRKIRKEAVAVITNSSLLYWQDVQKELSSADFVIAKLDACSQDSFMAINQPFQGAEFDVIVQGIKEFRKHFQGKFALQIMFMHKNIQYAGDIAAIAKDIHPDEIQINTPLRPCDVEPLKREELSKIKDLFDGLNTVSVYESQKKIIRPISDDDTLRRRGKI